MLITKPTFLPYGLLFLFVSFTGVINLLAQQKLNLGFEDLSVEGVARPWGWSVHAYAANVSFSCDSTQAYNSKYSLKISGDTANDDTAFALAFPIEPNQITDQQLSLAFWAKSTEFKGKAGIKIETVGKIGDEYGILAEQDIPISSGKNWQNYRLPNFEIGDQLHTLRISAYFQGTGTVWLDEITLAINGNPVAAVPVAPAFTPTEQAWINKQAIPFQGITPSKEYDLSKVDFSDLAPFKKMVGNATIIALGEATHGTSEFFQLKHKLLQYSIHELGVRVFVLEDNQLLVERINDFVLDGKGEARQVIKGLFAVWNTQEMLDLINWLRTYNKMHPNDKVAFVGMDVQNPALALAGLQSFLSQQDSVLQLRTDTLLQAFKTEWRNSYFKEESVLQKWVEDTQAVYDLVAQKEEEWTANAKTNTDRTTIRWAIQNARLLHQCATAMLSRGFDGREEGMAQNIDWIKERYPHSKRMLIWAHDTHVSRGDAPDPEENYYLGLSLGSRLSDKYGSNYCSFGLYTYAGTCRGTISYSNFEQLDFSLYTSPVGSLDEGLHQAAVAHQQPYLMLNLKTPPGKAITRGGLDVRRPVRYVGYVSEDFGFYGRYLIAQQFDGILFVDQSTASQKIR